MADQTPVADTPSGIPMAVEMYGDVMEEQPAPTTALTRAPSKSARSITVIECEPEDVEEGEVEVLPAQSADDELDEIIDRVIEVVKARRAGKAVPPRRRRGEMVQANPSALAGAESTKMNPNTKALVYAGVGVGAAALIGGLWWYFKKK